jgi:hypothetical protein
MINYNISPKNKDGDESKKKKKKSPYFCMRNDTVSSPTYLFYIYIQISFKFIIESINVGPINLKIKDIKISFIYLA